MIKQKKQKNIPFQLYNLSDNEHWIHSETLNINSNPFKLIPE